MCFVKNLTVTFLFGSPVDIKNRSPAGASQARIPQFRVIERFCV